MFEQDQYTLLLASLPAYTSLFAAHHTPLSRRKLDARLTMLTPAHRQQLQRIETTLCWDNIAVDAPSELLVTRFTDLLKEMADTSLLSVIRSRLDLRTIVTALQWRHYFQAEPEGEWSPSPLRRVISNNWSAPGFNLELRYPWVTEVETCLQAGQLVALEKRLLHTVWHELQRHPSRYQSSFAAVVIYVLKWDIIDRWTRYQPGLAAERFNRLIASGMPTGDWMAGGQK